MHTVVFAINWPDLAPKGATVKEVTCRTDGFSVTLYTWTEEHPADAIRRDINGGWHAANLLMIGCEGEISRHYLGSDTYYVCTDGNGVENMAVKMAMIWASQHVRMNPDGMSAQVEYDGVRYPDFVFPKCGKGYSLPGIKGIHAPMWHVQADPAKLSKLINIGTHD